MIQVIYIEFKVIFIFHSNFFILLEFAFGLIEVVFISFIINL